MLNFNSSRLFYKPLIVAITALTTSITATADDLDVFRAMIDSQNIPNILFVLDYSGSMNWDIYGNRINDNTTLSKFDILESAVNNLLENNKGKVNVGLGSTYNWRASGVRWPISDLTANANTLDPDIPLGDNITVADVIAAQLNRKAPRNATATVNALAEAAAYFRGDDVLHSDYSTNNPMFHRPDQWNINAEAYAGGNDYAAMPSSYSPANAYNFANNTWTTPKYNSPLTKQCQANFIVLISDGQPTSLRNTQTLDTVLGAAGIAGISDCENLSTTIFDDSNISDSKTGNCGPEIVEYLANNDINPDIPGSKVNTFTVGFAVDGDGKDYLELLANKGDGDFYEASEPAALTSALNSIIDSILADSQNFAELSVDIDPTTFSHDDRAYFSLFSPSSQSGWDGNLKGYFVDESGLIDIKGEKATVQSPGGLRFADTAHSFWSSVVDGNDSMLGGASETIIELPEGPNNRNIYTYLGGGADKSLPLDNQNLLSIYNPAIDNNTMNTTSDAERVAALNWIANAPMGDPLHTKPVTVTYENLGEKTNVVYIMTNQGFIHAFDATKPLAPDNTTPDITGGAELFAFMPKELLPNLPELHTPTNDAEHVYGLDGPITRWHNDKNKDGMVNGTDTVQLVFGMRRGGYSYYSLDVTNPNLPAFKWQISKGDVGFEKLAQTWSRASLVSVQVGTDESATNEKDRILKERVLMFAGGYDADTVDNTSQPTAASGNAVYMVDENGSLIWSIDDNDHPDMEFSIPSDLAVIDTDGNGAADRAYFGDLGGQVWRVDFDDINNPAGPTLTKFADIKDNGEHQPIFYAPSVSMNKEYGSRYLAVAFGTGDRTQPMLKTSGNAFFMLRDQDYKVGPPEATPTTITITRSAIYNATNNDIGSSNTTIRDQAKADLKQASGWVVFLNPGEKALSKVVTYDGKFLATTFEPDEVLDENGVPDPCQFSMFGRLYVMDLRDATPVKLMDDGTETTEGLDKMARITNLNSTTIPSKPVVIFPANDSKAQIIVDKESVVAVNKQVTTVYWHAK